MSMDKNAARDRVFWEYVHTKYQGKVHRIERHHTPEFMGLRVLVEFRLPEDDVDELEIYKRIVSVLDVVVEGKEPNNVS